MKKEYDFSKAVRKNPYAERMKNGYTIIIERGSDTDESDKGKKIKPVIDANLVVAEATDVYSQ